MQPFGREMVRVPRPAAGIYTTGTKDQETSGGRETSSTPAPATKDHLRTLLDSVEGLLKVRGAAGPASLEGARWTGFAATRSRPLS